MTFTPELLRQMERNSNFVARAGILQAPVKYDHPAFGAPDKENHGKLVRYEVRNNSLFTAGTNWSERLQADKAREARLAYSPEFVAEFSYPDPISGKMVTLGPTVVGLAILGGDRPAIKNLKPLAQFEFGENVGPADEFLMREELRAAGMVSEYVDGQHYFGEVENDARRFFSESQKEHTMTDQEIKDAIAAGVKAGVAAELNTAVAAAVAPLQQQIKSFSETSKREGVVRAFCEAVKTTKPSLNTLSLGRLEKILLHSDMTDPLAEEVKAFVESLSAVIVPAGRGKGKEADVDVDEEQQNFEEPPNLARIRPSHFADRSKNETLLAAAITDLEKAKPKLFSEAKAVTLEQKLAVTKQYVVEREAAAN